MNYDEIWKLVETHFAEFNKPSALFCGGRFQTPIPYVFAHIDVDGKLKKIEVDKPGGTRFFLKSPK